MFIIDFDTDWKAAFRHGFLKGLAAPVSLFGYENTPDFKVVHLSPPSSKTEAQSLAEDWRQVGKDFRRVIHEYASEETKNHNSTEKRPS